MKKEELSEQRERITDTKRKLVKESRELIIKANDIKDLLVVPEAGNATAPSAYPPSLFLPTSSTSESAQQIPLLPIQQQRVSISSFAKEVATTAVPSLLVDNDSQLITPESLKVDRYLGS